MALEAALQALGAPAPARGGRTPTPPAWQALNAEEAAKQPQRNADQARLLAAERTVGDPVTRPDLTEAQWNAQAGFGGAAANDGALAGALEALEPARGAGKAEEAPKAPRPNKYQHPAWPVKIGEEPPPTYGTSAAETAKFVGSLIAAPGAALAAGAEGIWDLTRGLVQGQSFDDAMTGAARAVKARQEAVAFKPETPQGEKVAEVMASPYNPLNWLPLGAKKVAEVNHEAFFKAADKLQERHPELADKVRRTGAAVVAVQEGAINAFPLAALNTPQARQPMRILPAERATTVGEIAGPVATEGLEVPTYLRRQQAAKAGQGATLGDVAAGVPPAPPARAAARPGAAARGLPGEKVSSMPPPAVDLGLEMPKAGTARALVESEPVKGGLPAAAQQERGAVLNRLGLKTVRRSALTGDALQGATEAQTTNLQQAAGQAARDQFAHESGALQAATAEIAQKSGGTLGVGEAADFARGSRIAALGDKLRQWFDTSERALYKAADERTQGLPAVSVQPVEALLKDRTFKNSVLARDKGHLLAAIEDQLNVFKETNPQGLTVKNAEQFRQWLNEQWTPENSAILGKVKGAVDKAVTAAAGEDVYGSSRAIHMLKKDTLDNPKGIARIWDADPRNPVNRATAIEKIPQTVERMPVEQFKLLVDTLRKKVPPELAAEAQAAQAEMKAHFVQGVLDAGTPNTKTPSSFWNNRRVNDYLAANREKMSYLFTKDELAQLADIRAGGNILAVDTKYPGAAAQAQNLAKAGLLSSIIPTVATGAGGGIGAFGGAFVGQPALGAVGGANLGRWLGEKASAASAEKGALKHFRKGVVKLGELTQ